MKQQKGINEMTTFTLPCGTVQKYTGKRDVKSFWYFQATNGVYVGGFSLNDKVAASTAKSKFRIYTDGHWDLIKGSIMVNLI
ncbi:MAG: hypothetical protein ACI9N9_002600 [Enterobacterales bacterium]